MKDLRIIFMGTPDFAVTILDGLLKDNYTIVGVITAPDKPSGRGRKMNQSAVKKAALANNLPILQPSNLKSESFLSELKSLNANLQIVVAFRMLPKVVWSMPKFGTFNLHASLLPNYRGAAPINWAIINGEKKTGVTTFFIDDKIDTGEIILQAEVEIKPDETVGELHDTLMYLGSELVNKTVHLIANSKIATKKQPKTEGKIAPKLFSSNCKIDWSKPLQDVYNHVRGLNPYPAAWSSLQNGKETIHVKIYDVIKESAQHNFEFGTIHTTKKELKIAVPNGYLIIMSLKLSGKRKMDTQNLLNGFTFDANAKML